MSPSNPDLPPNAPLSSPEDAVGAVPPRAAGESPIEKMGESFIRLGLLTEEQVRRVVQLQHTENLRFGQAAVQLGFVSEEVVHSVLAEQYRYDYMPKNGQAMAIPLPIAAAPFSPEAEAIRQLRASISIRMAGLPRFSVAVLSPGEHEGRSYLSASLAIAYSQTRRPTLLINANLRSGGQESLLGVATSSDGLSSILAGRAGTGPVREIPGFPMLAVLDAGPQPPNPAELLREPALSEVIAAYSDRFEIFVINTPPLNLSADAQSIARQVDGCVLLARKDVTRLAELERATQSLEAAGAPLLGTVYNEYDQRDASPRGFLKRLAWLGRLRR